MNQTIIATQQTIWDCRWSRPGYRLTGVEDSAQPEAIWMCVRTSHRRAVNDEECARCPHWEAEEGRRE